MIHGLHCVPVRDKDINRPLTRRREVIRLHIHGQLSNRFVVLLHELGCGYHLAPRVLLERHHNLDVLVELASVVGGVRIHLLVVEVDESVEIVAETLTVA